MENSYTETPCNFSEIEPYVRTDIEEIAALLLGAEICWFYDACSFRRHANFREDHAAVLIDYIHKSKGVFVLTRGVLMELASKKQQLHSQYVSYLRQIKEAGVEVLVLYEEDLYFVMDLCFSTNHAINEYLIHAVRMVNRPTSTIRTTLEENPALSRQVLAGKNQSDRELYRKFFTTVRANKESDDNLGEELLAVCLYLLTHLPGEGDGKYRLITDDKAAAAMVNNLFQSIPNLYRGSAVGIFSTPKLVQVLHTAGMELNKEQTKQMLETGTDGNIGILGRRIYHIHYEECTFTSDQLADLILTENGISIAF